MQKAYAPTVYKFEKAEANSKRKVSTNNLLTLFFCHAILENKRKYVNKVMIDGKNPGESIRM